MKKKLSKTKYNDGFTLIELLVVISIITLLASIVLVSTLNARVSARNTKRVADIGTLTEGLELYYNDNNQYPTTPVGICNTSMGDVSCGSLPTGNSWTSGSGIGAIVTKGYASSLPLDPTNNTTNQQYYTYRASSNGQSYMLVTDLEKTFQQKVTVVGPASTLMLADENGDGLISAVDASMVLACVGISPVNCPYTADINQDGVIDINDVNIVRSLVGKTY